MKKINLLGLSTLLLLLSSCGGERSANTQPAQEVAQESVGGEIIDPLNQGVTENTGLETNKSENQDNIYDEDLSDLDEEDDLLDDKDCC